MAKFSNFYVIGLDHEVSIYHQCLWLKNELREGLYKEWLGCINVIAS